MKEPKRTVAVNRLKLDVSRIIPGDWGKAEPGWLAQPLFKPTARPVAEAAFTSSSGGVRAPSVSRTWNCAVRNDKKPFRAGSSSPGGFRTWANRSYPEGIRLLLCISTSERLWRSPSGGQPKERRRKAGQSERSHREGHVVSAGPVKTFRKVGDVKNDTADL